MDTEDAVYLLIQGVEIVVVVVVVYIMVMVVANYFKMKLGDIEIIPHYNNKQQINEIIVVCSNDIKVKVRHPKYNKQNKKCTFGEMNGLKNTGRNYTKP